MFPTAGKIWLRRSLQTASLSLPSGPSQGEAAAGLRVWSPRLGLGLGLQCAARPRFGYNHFFRLKKKFKKLHTCLNISGKEKTPTFPLYSKPLIHLINLQNKNSIIIISSNYLKHFDLFTKDTEKFSIPVVNYIRLIFLELHSMKLVSLAMLLAWSNRILWLNKLKKDANMH